MNKEQIQKFVLIGLFAGGGIYAYFDFLLGPLNRRETSSAAEIRKLEPLIREAQIRIKRTRTIEESDPYATAAGVVFDLMEAKIPKEASVAWLPQRMDAYFSSAGFDKGSFRQEEEKQDTIAPLYKRSAWEVEFTKGDFFKLGKALAAMENGEGLLQVTRLKVETTPTDPARQRVLVGFQTLVKP